MICFAVFIFLFFPAIAISSEKQILINEFSIDSSPQQTELINNSSESADISGWYLDDSGGTTYYVIPQNTVLLPHSCYVITTDLNLNKSSSDILRLFDSSAPPTSLSAKIIDSYTYKISPGINNSYYRLPDGDTNWIFGPSSIGKWNFTGENCVIFPSATPTLPTSPTLVPSSVPIPTNESTPTPVFIENVFISEVMTYPESGESEWIELYNKNDFEIHLINWYIDDIENGGSTPKIFSLTIPAKGYSVFSLSSSLFNNTGDSVRLLDQTKNQRDGFEYEKNEKGKTLGRISLDSDEYCLQIPSKGVQNNECITPTKTQERVSSSSVANIVPTTMKNFPTIVLRGNKNTFISSPSILGVSEEIQIPQTKKTNQQVKQFSFLSFSYSILTIASIFFKIKNGA